MGTVSYYHLSIHPKFYPFNSMLNVLVLSEILAIYDFIYFSKIQRRPSSLKSQFFYAYIQSNGILKAFSLDQIISNDFNFIGKAKWLPFPLTALNNLTLVSSLVWLLTSYPTNFWRMTLWAGLRAG